MEAKLWDGAAKGVEILQNMCFFLTLCLVVKDEWLKA